MALSLDGHNNGFNFTASTVAAAVTTTGAGRVFVMVCAETASATQVPSISSVTGGGLTWQVRKALNGTGVSVEGASPIGSCCEEWYADSAGALTAQTITAHFAFTGGGTQFDDASIVVWGVKGSNIAFDVNANWPASLTVLINNTAITITSLSTTAAASMVFAGWASFGGPTFPATMGSGFSAVDSNNNQNGINASTLQVEEQIFASAQPNQTWGFTPATAGGFYLIVDAVYEATPIVGGIGRDRKPSLLAPSQGPSRGLWAAQAFPTSGVVDTLLTAASGSFTLTGEAATFDVGMPAAFGSFTLTGEAALLGPGIVAASGSFALTGEAATFDMKTSAAFGSFALTGEPVIFGVGLTAAFGSFTFTGEAATFDTAMPAVFGSFAFTGEPATFSSPGFLTAGFGSFVFTGEVATLTASSSTTTVHDHPLFTTMGKLSSRR